MHKDTTVNNQNIFNLYLCNIQFVSIKNLNGYLQTGSNFIATLTLGGAGAHGSYYHKANDQVNAHQQNESCLDLCLLLYNDICFVVWY